MFLYKEEKKSSNKEELVLASGITIFVNQAECCLRRCQLEAFSRITQNDDD